MNILFKFSKLTIYIIIAFTVLIAIIILQSNKIKNSHMTQNNLVDKYSWMRDSNWPNVEDKNILEYLKNQNTLTENYFEKNEKLKAEIFEEIKSRIKLEDQSTYVKKDDYLYYSRIAADQNYRVYCRKKISDNENEEILLDHNELAKGKKFAQLGSLAVSPDHKLYAYSIDFDGSEHYTIKIFDIKTKTYFKDEISNVIGGIIWHENLNGFFYNKLNDKWRHDKVFFHKLGTDPLEDQLVYHEKDELFNTSVMKSSSKEYIFIKVSGHNSSEYHYIDMKDQSLSPKLITLRHDEIFYDVEHNGQYFYIRTNDLGDNFRLARTLASNPSKNNWEDYIKLDPIKYLDSIDITANYLILNYKYEGLVKPEILDLNTNLVKYLKFNDPAYEACCYSTNFLENDIRYEYSSLAMPDTTYQYDWTNEKSTILKIHDVPSGFNPELYKVERLWVNTDGVKVPLSIFYKKDLFKDDGSNPLLLYGYGSYGISIPARFSRSIISLVDRGFVYAIAHIRGGSELGHDWYKQAKFKTKQRTFNDFIAATEFLVENKYSSPTKITIMGGSAGGLLIGNVMNARPELFNAAIMHVPFVDVLNTMLDESLPLTPGEFKEWGNPKEQEYFDYILIYSPYENIKAQNYPNIYITAGLTDPRVGYWEASKFYAKLKELKTDDNLLLLKTNMDSGHQGASGRFDYLKEVAEDYVFILNVTK